MANIPAISLQQSHFLDILSLIYLFIYLLRNECSREDACSVITKIVAVIFGQHTNCSFSYYTYMSSAHSAP